MLVQNPGFSPPSFRAPPGVFMGTIKADGVDAGASRNTAQLYHKARDTLYRLVVNKREKTHISVKEKSHGRPRLIKALGDA